MASFVELTQTVKQLVRQNRHSEALEKLYRALGDSEAWTEQQGALIQGEINQVQTKQKESFERILNSLTEDYLEAEYTTPGEMVEVEETVKTLASIDDTHSALSSLEKQVARLRLNSEVQWAYDQIEEKVREALNKASTDSDVTRGMGQARTALSDLKSKTLPEWEARQDQVARLLVPRLHQLVAKINKQLQQLAERVNILTTQAGQINFWTIEEEYQRWIAPPVEGEPHFEPPPPDARNAMGRFYRS